MTQTMSSDHLIHFHEVLIAELRHVVARRRSQVESCGDDDAKTLQARQIDELQAAIVASEKRIEAVRSFQAVRQEVGILLKEIADARQRLFSNGPPLLRTLDWRRRVLKRDEAILRKLLAVLAAGTSSTDPTLHSLCDFESGRRWLETIEAVLAGNQDEREAYAARNRTVDELLYELKRLAQRLERRRDELEGALEFDAEKCVNRAAGDAGLAGLAFSGGGIRSATFNLGVLQALSEYRMLPMFDYLSTISGGGYIGSWLTAWIQREGAARVEAQACFPPSGGAAAAAENDPRSAIDNVSLQLHVHRAQQGKATRPPFVRNLVEANEPEPIHHLRRYSSYLAPRLGFLSTDTWTLIAIYLRNLVFVQLTVLPAVMAVLMLVRLIVCRTSVQIGGSPGTTLAAFGVIFALLLWTSFHSISWNLICLHLTRIENETPGRLRHIGLTTVIAPLLLAASLFCWAWVQNPSWFRAVAGPRGAFLSIAAMALVHSLGGLTSCLGFCWARRRRPDSFQLEKKWLPYYFVGSVGAGALGGLLVYWFVVYFLNVWGNAPHVVATFGPPLLLGAFLIGGITHVALVGKWFREAEREWWASVGAWLLIWIVGWLIVFGVSLFGPLGVKLVDNHYLQTGLAAGWLATSVAGALTGRSSSTGRPGVPLRREYLGAIAPPVFLLGLVVAVGCLVGAICDRPPYDAKSAQPSERAPEKAVILSDWQNEAGAFRLEWFEDKDAAQKNDSTRRTKSAAIIERHWAGVNAADWRQLLLGVFVCGFIIFLTGIGIDVNLFSLHALYANRLVRCYLGASRPKREDGGARANTGLDFRQPDDLTGFDPQDDLRMSELLTPLSPDAAKPYYGPFPIVGTALNLVGGDELAWQERKAASFFLSPLYCGSEVTGFRKIDENAELSLGRAVAISGAAADPNMGYHSSPALTALMTVFNVRLGWWVRNPRDPDLQGAWKAEGPWFAPWYLTKELFGLTNEKERFLRLSDGGHFENLGVYELVRRRCRYIVVIDAGADGNFTFFDLAALVRKCSTDLGVRIEIDVEQLRRDAQTGRSQWHCAVGAILYDQVDDEARLGTLVYLKPSLTGDERTDVTNYKDDHHEFPHESTGDQFFNETQFESYRALGYHVATTVFSPVADEGVAPEKGRLFRDLRQAWFPLPPGVHENFTATVDSFLQLHRALRNDPVLGDLSRQLYPEAFAQLPAADRAEAEAAIERLEAAGARERREEDKSRRDLHTVTELIQCMESAFINLQLDQYHAHPIYREWLTVFRRWANADVVQGLWPILRGEFSVPFVTFCETELGLQRSQSTTLVQLDGLHPKEGTESEFETRNADQDAAIALLHSEFDREWLMLNEPDDRSRGRTYPTEWKNVAMWLTALGRLHQENPRVRPPFWIIGVGPETVGTPERSFPCGFASVNELPREQDKPRRFEFVLWFRGAFRVQRLGEQCIRDVIKAIAGHFQSLLGPDEASAEFDLRVTYPRRAFRGRGGNLQKRIWKRFFTENGFREMDMRGTPTAVRYVHFERRLTVKRLPDRTPAPTGSDSPPEGESGQVGAG